MLIVGQWLDRARLDQLRASVAAPHAASHQATARYDSLIQAKRGTDPASVLRQIRGEQPSVVPVPCYVLIGTLGGSTSAETEPVRSKFVEWASEIYPQMPRAWSELAMSQLAAGDLAAARTSAALATKLDPWIG